MNLSTIKPQVFEVKIGKNIYYLKYNLEAFAFIEEELGNIIDAIKNFNEKDFNTAAVFFCAGLIYTRQQYDIIKLVKKADPKELINIIAKAINDVICPEYGFDKEFDWPLLYFIAKPALNFSEEEFWQSTPKKILTMMKMLEEMKIGKNNETLTENKAAQAFIAW